MNYLLALVELVKAYFSWQERRDRRERKFFDLVRSKDNEIKDNLEFRARYRQTIEDQLNLIKEIEERENR